MQGEESAGLESVASYPKNLAKIIDEAGYTKQVYMLCRISKARRKSMPDFKSSKKTFFFRG